MKGIKTQRKHSQLSIKALYSVFGILAAKKNSDKLVYSTTDF